MNRTQWLLSVFLVTFVAIKVGEGISELETWPFTNTPMFARRLGPEKLPLRATLRGMRGGAWVEVTPADLALSEDELPRQIVRYLRIDRDFGSVCRVLGRQYNARHLDAPFSVLVLRVERLSRPGVSRAGEVLEVPCDLGEATNAAR